MKGFAFCYKIQISSHQNLIKVILEVLDYYFEYQPLSFDRHDFQRFSYTEGIYLGNIDL